MLFGSAHLLLPLYDVVEKSITPSISVPVQLCGADPNRVCLILSAFTSSSVGVATTAITTTTTGLMFTNGSPMMEFNIRDHPGLVQSAWWVAKSNATPNVEVITIAEHPLEGM